MSIQSERDFKGIAAAGKVVRLAIEAMRKEVRAGVSTGELDAIAGRVFAEHGARSAPNMVYGFPGQVCISINEEAVHGVPGDRVIREGDLVKLDVTAEKGGYMADAAVTVAVEPVAAEDDRLLRCARSAFYKALAVAKAGTPVNEIGRAVEREVKRSGFVVIRELSGHGIGRSIHEEPSVPNYYDPAQRDRLTEGLVITIEPIITSSSGRVVEERDGWTISTANRRPAAHFEHTMVITRGRAVVVT